MESQLKILNSGTNPENFHPYINTIINPCPAESRSIDY